MAKKRIQRKQEKKEQNKKLLSSGLTKKEVKRMTTTERKNTVEKIEINERKQQLRNKNREFIKKHNLKHNYIIDGKKYTPSQLIDLGEKTLKKLARRQYYKDLQERKINKLLANGFSIEEAEKYKNKKFDIIDNLIFLGDRTVYIADAYLMVLWADVTGDSEWSLALEQYKSYSTVEMIETLHKLIDNFQKGSAGFKGVPLIAFDADKEYLKQLAKSKYFKGYNKTMVTEKTHVLTANQWTLRGYVNMMLSILDRTVDDMFIDALEDFKTYAREFLPEIYRQIF